MAHQDYLNQILERIALDGGESIRQLERPDLGEDSSGVVNFDDPKICDAPDCTETSTKFCGQCGCRVFCCKECQVESWKSHHKKECKLLKYCLQTSQIEESSADLREKDAVVMAVTATRSHGTHFYIMEQYQYYGNESNRRVVLASTTDLSDKGIATCIIDSILYPEFDCDAGGRRRPYYVEVLKKTFPDESTADKIATLLVRLGITIKSFEDHLDMDAWCSHWFFVQQGWLDELHDEMFLALIDEDRRRPLQPNGMARREVASAVKESSKATPRLDPKDYPTRKDAMKLPYARKKAFLYAICKDATLYIVSGTGRLGQIVLRQKVQLQKRTGRPYAEDVFLCIYKALVDKVKERPDLLMVGQPSVCVLADVKVFENTLDKSICRKNMSLAHKNNLEGMLDDMLAQGA